VECQFSVEKVKGQGHRTIDVAGASRAYWKLGLTPLLGLIYSRHLQTLGAASQAPTLQNYNKFIYVDVAIHSTL